MQKIISITCSLLLLVSQLSAQSVQPVLVSEADLNSRILSKFYKNHHPRSTVTWWQDETKVQASFSEEQVQWTISYDQNGKCATTIKRYSSEKLSNNIRDLLSASFADFEISGITELIVGSRQIHYINLVSRTKAKQVAVYNQEITVQQEFDLR